MSDDIKRRIRQRDADGKVITVDFKRPAALEPEIDPRVPEDTGDFHVAAQEMLREHTPIFGEAAAFDPRSRAKWAAFSEMIEDGMVMVTLDSRRPGVDVPAEFRGVPALNLNFSLRFYIEDFDWDLDGVRATLAFESGEYLCIVPWTAVYVMSCVTSEKVFVAPDDMPEERRARLPALLAAIEESLDSDE